MKWLRALCVFLALAIAAASVLLAVRGELLRARIEGAVQGLIERQGSAWLGAPLRLETLHVGFLPPALGVTGLALGEGGAIARAHGVQVRLLAGASLREWRPVIDAMVDQPEVDVPALLRALPAPADETVIPPPFRLHLTLRAPRAHLSEQPAARLEEGDWVETAVSVDAASRRLSLAATAARLRLDLDGRAAALDALSLRLEDSEAGWHLRSLGIDSPGLRLDTTEQGEGLRIEATVELGQQAWFGEAAAGVGGTAGLDATLTGPLQAPALRGVLAVPNLTLAGQSLGAARLEFAADRQRAEVTAARLQGVGGTTELTATLQLDDALSYRAEVRLGDVALSALPVPGADAAPALVGHGGLTLSGTLAPLRVSADGDGGFVPRAPGAALTWHAAARYGAGAGSAQLELAQGVANRVHGEWSLDAGGALQGEVTLELRDIAAVRALLPAGAAQQWRAEVSAAARFAGTLAEPEIGGRLSLRDLRWRDLSVARFEAEGTGNRQALRNLRVTAGIGGGTLAAEGTIALAADAENHWQVRAQGLDGSLLAALLEAATGAQPPLTGGGMALAASASGPWSGLRLEGTARLDDLSIAGEVVAQVQAALRADGERWALDATARNRAQQRLAVTASGRAAADLAIELRSDGWTLGSAWRDGAPHLGGTLRLDAALRGGLQHLDGHVALSAADLVAFNAPLGALSISATARGGDWHGSAVLFGGAVSVNGRVGRDPGHPFTIDGIWREAELPALSSAPSELRIASSGALHVDGRLAALSDSAVTLEMSALTISNGPLVLVLEAPLVGRCARRRCRLERGVLRAGDSILAIAGEGGFDGRGRIDLQGSGSLELLELAGPPIESAAGRFSLDATVARESRGWEARGAVTIEALALDAGLPVSISHTDGRFLLDGDALRIEALGGRMNSGRFAVGGLIDWRAGPQLTWELSDVGLEPLPGLDLEVSARGRLDRSWQAPHLAGEIAIARLLYDRDVGLTDLLPSFDRALAAAPRSPGGRDLTLDLHVIAPGELYVENNIARLEGRADVRLRGRAAQPVLEGRVEALDGEVYVRSRTFELVGATADFRPDLGLAAALNLSAESFINTPEAAYTVAVQVTGTTTDPRVTLSSDDPTLSQTDIATLIAVGKTTAQLRTGGGISISDALGVVPAQVADLVEGPAQRLLPVDRIEFEPSFSRTSGTFEPQLKIGKDLTESLSASVGQTFGVAARTRVEVNYHLGPRVSVPLGWESQTEKESGAFSAGVELRYEFWRLTPFTLLSGLW